MAVQLGRLPTAELSGPSRPAGLERIWAWLLPGMAVLVPLAVSPALVDSFELAKLAMLRLGLAVALVVLALGAPLDLAVVRTPPGRAALVFLGVSLLAK